jgi:hypothetical protein
METIETINIFEEYEKLKADNKRLREALEFYAKEYNYRSATVYMCGHRGAHNIDSDRGNKARAALKGNK